MRKCDDEEHLNLKKNHFVSTKRIDSNNGTGFDYDDL